MAMDPLEALLLPVGDDEKMRALARSLRGRQVAADFFAGSTIPALQQIARGEQEYISDVASQQGRLREALDRRLESARQNDQYLGLQRELQSSRATENERDRALQRELQGRDEMLQLSLNALRSGGTVQKPPKDAMWNDPADPSKGVSYIPGTATAVKMQKEAEREQLQRETTKYSLIRAMERADTALSNINEFSTGILGQFIGKTGLADTDRTALEEDIFTLKSMLTLENLAALKELSATGASGFGNLSNIEGEKLASTIASLNVNQPPEKLQENLLMVKRHFQNMLDMADGKLPAEYAEGGQDAAPQSRESEYERWKRENSQ